MIKIPTGGIVFGADAQESETIYIEGTNLTYSVNRIQGGSVALYGLEPYGRGYLFTATAVEWQEGETDNIDDVVFSDGKDTATIRVSTHKSPSGMLIFDENLFDFSWKGGEKTLIFKIIGITDTSTLQAGSNGSVTSASISDLAKVTDGTYTGKLTVTMGKNTSKFATGLAWIAAKDDDGYSIRRDIQCLQSSRKVFPCWKDEMLDILVGEFTVVDSNENKTVYRGYSEKGEVNVGKIVRPLVRSSYELEFSDDFITDEKATFDFSVIQNGYPLQNYMAYDDYSIEGSLGSAGIINDPIQLKAAKNQPYTISILNTTGDDDTVTLDGGEVTVPQGVSHYGYVLDSDSLSASYNGSSISWDVVDWCGKWIIYYINAKGGVDWLLTEGNSLKNDSMANGRFEQPYTNGSQTFGKRDYLRTVTKKLTVHTGWLSDIESFKMHNLMESARVWAYDTEENKIIPVLISDTSLDYKTFDNQGRQLVQYDITLEFSHTFERR